MSKVSIIIPVYNVEKYLARCLDSVINQTYADLEIICVNDGSPDSSLDILKKYEKQDSRIKVIDKKNGGLSTARNAGLKIVTGEYIVFLDSDDWLEIDAIEKLYNIIEQENVDIVRGNYYTNLEEKQLIQTSRVEGKYFAEDENFEKSIFLQFLNGSLPCYVCLFMYKTSVIKKNNLYFDENILFMEDMIFTINLLTKIKNIYFSDYAFYHYYINPNGLTRSRDKYIKNIQYMPKLFEKAKADLINSRFNDKKYIEIRKSANTKIVMSYLYLIFRNSNGRKDFENTVNLIFKDNTIVNLMENSNLQLLGKNLKNRIEQSLLKILLEGKYKNLYFFYCIRNKLEKVLLK